MSSQHLFLKRSAVLSAALWSIAIIASLVWCTFNERLQLRSIALVEARTSFQKDLAFMQWAFDRSGFYAEEDETVLPNPKLAALEERDIVTPSGKRLTLLNHTYMQRLFLEDYEKRYGIKSGMAALDPIWPGNSPDEWERAALSYFIDKGETSFYGVGHVDGQEYFRYMEPMRAAEACLGCHESKALGSVIGGFGVNVPMAPLNGIIWENIKLLALAHGVIYALGLAGIAAFFLRSKSKLDAEIIMEQSLNNLEQRFMDVTRNSGECFWEADAGGKLTYISPVIRDILGYEPEELLNKGFESLVDGQDEFTGKLNNCLALGEDFSNVKSTRTRKDGTQVIILTSAVPVRAENGLITGCRGVDRDITLEERQRVEIHNAMVEQKALLSEVHHRVKNNLQIISSLLRLQSARVRDKGGILHNSINRIHSMALVHEHLYKGERLSSVDCQQYLKGLIAQLIASHKISTRVEADLSCSGVAPKPDKLLPVGMIVNELASNSLKHVFAKGLGSNIALALWQDEAGVIHLRYGDDGPALPGHLDFNAPTTLGIEIVHALVGQLEGELKIEDSRTIHITFPAESLESHVGGPLARHTSFSDGGQ